MPVTTTLDPVTQFQNIIKPYLNAIVENQIPKSALVAYGFFLDAVFDNLVANAITETNPDLDNAYVDDLEAKILDVKNTLKSLTSVITSMSAAKLPTRKAKKVLNNPITTTTTTTTTVAP